MIHLTTKEEVEKNIDRRKKFPIIFINIIFSAILSISTLYFFVFQYGYTINRNLSIFALYTLFFGIINCIGIVVMPKIFLPIPRNDRRSKNGEKEDISDFFNSSIVMTLLGIVMIIIVNWYS